MKTSRFLLWYILLFLGVVFLLLKPGVVSAATGTNKQINFQGKVVNKTVGTNVTDGTYSFTFSIYSVSSGGAAIWTETKNLTVTNGIFQTMLGDTTSLPGSVDFNTDNLYLGINFNSDGEMSPRVRFGAVPQAMNALKVAGLTVTDTTGTLTIPNGKTISFADAFTTSGANPLTLTTTSTTNVTLPTTGTLATLTGTEIFTNKTIGSTGLTFSGATFDVTTGTNEAFTVRTNGSGDINLQVDTDSNVYITDGSNLNWIFGASNEYGTQSTTIGTTGGSVDSLSIAADNSSGNYSGDLISLVMDGVNSNGFSGNGLHIVVDDSQNSGYPILIEDDGVNTLFSVSDSGVVNIKNAFNEGGSLYGITGGQLQLQSIGVIIKNFAQGQWGFNTDQPAGSGATFESNAITLNALNGSDTVIGSAINITNANHTGSSNFVYGLSIAGITGDAEASETGLVIGTGWDTAIEANGDIRFADGESLSNSADTIILASNATNGAGVLRLPVKTTTGDPSLNVEGNIYYNTVDNKFRCYQNTGWTDCIGSGPGGSTAFDTINDPSGNGAIAMAATTQTLDWDTDAGTGALDGMTVTFQNDITTDASVQRAFVVRNANDGGSTGKTEALIAVDNADTNETVTNGLQFTASGNWGYDTAINIATNLVTTDISLQSGETIDNDVDGQISIGTQTARANLAVFGEIMKKGFTNEVSLSNITDIFVYDTTRDSDAGQWTEPVNSSFLSWYTETKDDGYGDICVITSDDRCGSSAFPKKAVLVTTVDGLYIFDAINNTMWMRFTQAGTYALGADANNNPSSVFALNGVVYVGTNGSSGTGLYAFDFVQNRMFRYNTTNRTQADVDIASRNSAVSYAGDAITAMQIRSNLVNDVHGAVLAGGSNIETNNAAANGATFIVAGTDASMSVINVTRRVTWDMGSALTDKFTSVYLTKRGRLYGLNSTKAQVERFGSVPSSANSPDFTRADSTTATDTWDEATGNLPNLTKTAPTITSNAPDTLEVVERGSLADESADQIFVGTNQGLTEIDDVNSPSGTSIGWSRFITTTSQTNLMNGTPRGMFNLEEASGNITDSTIRNSILTPKGSLTYGADGVIGKAMTFDNATGYLCSDANADATCDTDADFNVAAISFSVELWFKHSTTAPASGTDVLVDKRYTAFAGAEGVGYTIEMNTSGQIIFGIQDTAATATYDDAVTSTQAYNNNQWHHLVAVNTDTALCLYIDGNLAVACDTALAATATLDASQILTIGADASGATGGNFWDGSIDQVYFSGGGSTTSDTLTAAQVRKKYMASRQALTRRSITVTDATTTSSTTIGDTGESWLLNEFVGSNVEITGGTGAGQTRKVVSNTSNTLTVTPSWTVTPDTTSDFEIMPEQLYGSTDTVTAIAMTDTDFLGAGRRLYVGTSNGTDGGGISVFNGGLNTTVTDVYHSDEAATDDNGSNWFGTDSDDIQSIDAKSNIFAAASLVNTWVESANMNYQASFDKLANNVNSVRSELVVDGLAGTSFEVGQTGGADVAEYYGASESLTPGQIVALDPENLAKVIPATRDNLTQSIGIVATNPGIILGEKVENAYPIALVGRVPTLVTNENGYIKAGERITVSARSPGYGARATFAGRVIGIALEDIKPDEMTPCSDGSTTLCGQVLTFVNLSDYLGGTLQAELDTGSLELTATDSADQELFTQQQKKLLAYLRQAKLSETASSSAEITASTINALSLNVDTITANTIKANQIAGLEIYTNKLRSLEEMYASLATESAQTGVLGASTSAQIQDDLASASLITRLLAQSKLIFSGQTEFQADSIFQGMTSFIQKVVFKGNVEFESNPIFSQDTAGFLVLTKGQRIGQVVFDKPYGNAPIVSVTAVADVDQATLDNIEKPETLVAVPKESYALTNVTEKGFTIVLEKAAEKDLRFSWIAITVKNAKTQFSTSSPQAVPSALPSPSAGLSATPLPSTPAPAPSPTPTAPPTASPQPSPTAEPSAQPADITTVSPPPASGSASN